MGIFGDYAQKYFASGYVVLPVDPESKACRITDWNSIFVKGMSEETLEQYALSHGHCGIGLVCGKASGIAAVDYDWTGDHTEILEQMILGAIPPTQVAKTGRKHWTNFYKLGEGVTLRHFKRPGEQKGFVDVLADGPGYTVLPPSRYNDELAYRYITDATLLDVETHDLPELTLSHVQAIESIAQMTNKDLHYAAKNPESRNDQLFGHFCFLFKSCKDLKALTDLVLAFDQDRHSDHPKGAYYADPKYVKRNMTGRQQAEKDVVKWFKYKVSKAKEQGVVVDENSSEVYPSQSNGFFDRKPKFNQKGEPVLDKDGNQILVDVPNYVELAAYLGNEDGLAVSQAFAYKYDKNYYRRIESLELKNRIDHLTIKKCKPFLVDDFRKSAEFKNFKPKEFFDHPEGAINLKNGVLDVKSRELRPHSKGIFFRYILPHDYDPDAKCPRWLESLEYAFEGNQALADISAEIFGYVLLGGDPWLHKAFVLSGSGRNGKSNWLNALKCLIGRENHSSIPMSNLDKPFSVVMADGKLANIVGELEGKTLNSEIFKIAVSGEDLTAAQKGKDEYQMRFLARLVFAANNLPGFKDTSVGNYEKLCILPFNRYISPKDRDPNIFAKIRPEMAGILNWALDGLDRLTARGMLPEIEAINEKIDEYRSANDTTYQWTQSFVKASVGSAKTYLLGAFYEHYAVWCEDEGRYPVAKNHFSRGLANELRRIDPTCLPSKTDNKLSLTGGFEITATPGRYERFRGNLKLKM